ncbi:MAG: hypothetical protein JEZ09_06240 [Salinivirgaceae bacterium]|nr:hypothetical protein [Salinivirgaceae bacterium]
MNIKPLHITNSLLIIVILIFISLPPHAIGQNQDVGLPYIKNYYPSEYMAHAQNFDIVQDLRGLMYFANFAGVLEFDGQQWRTIQTDNISQVTSLAIDSLGRIYVGGRGEIGYLSPNEYGTLQYESLLDSLDVSLQRFQKVITVIATNQGVFFVTESSILLWNGSMLKVIIQKSQIKSAFYINNKLYFHEYSKGLQFYVNTKVYSLFANNSDFANMDIKNMLTFEKNRILICTANNGILLYNDSSITQIHSSTIDYLKKNIISSAEILADGTIALGTERSGVVLVNRDASIKQTISKSILSNNVNTLYVDNTGTLWLALNSGIAQLTVPSQLSFFNESKGIRGTVKQVLRNNGILYFSTNEGLYTYDKVKDAFSLNPFIQSSCWSIISDKDKILVATSKGVYLVSNSQKVDLVESGFSFAFCKSKFNESVIYVGHQYGLKKLNKQHGKWICTKKISEITNEITEIEEDENGKLWMIISTRGVVCVNPNNTAKPFYYDDTKGLPSRFGNHISKVNNKIIVTTQEGLYHYDSVSDNFVPLESFLNDSLLCHNWLSVLVEDAKGNVWNNSGDEKNIRLSTSAGEDKLAGIVLKPIKDATISTIYIDNDSKVWFGGFEGAICYNQNIEHSLNKQCNVLIRSVYTSNDSLLFGGTYYNEYAYPSLIQPINLIPELDYNHNKLVFEYASPSYNINEDVKYQYLLEGYENIWSVWSTKYQKEYTNLPAGEYIFKVKAKNIYGFISEPALYEFSIKKPWYQTIVAFILYVIALLTVLIIIVKIRSQKLVQEKRNLEDLIEKRTNVILCQKEELESQSAKLSSKNDELEKINLIVKSINSEVSFSSLLQSILERIRVIRGVEKATMIVKNKATNMFSFKAAFGWDISKVSDMQLSLSQIEDYYLSSAEELHEHIFDIKKLNIKQSNLIFEKLEKAKSIMIMMVVVEKEVEGFLILENVYKKQMFSLNDFSLLNNLKEHVISAFIKTNILEDLENTLENLKNTQEQLIQQEKMASIGQLTKGIVDRILNPLNYINNFSLLTSDLSDEIKEVIEPLDGKIEVDTYDDVLDLLAIVKANVSKINEHGNSASRIVKGMEKLLKERSTIFVLTDINALVENNIEISLKAYKAENKNFEATIIKKPDAKSEKVLVLPYELGMVIRNTFENACFVVEEKAKKVELYQPEIMVSTYFTNETFEIKIMDNGSGIPQKEQEQLFSPFFTTKPTAKGTGLGLYMSMDIVKSHKGTIEVDSQEGEYTAFTIIIPNKKEL